MAAPTQYYVAYTSGSDDTGTGAIGAPWKTIQKALDSITRDPTNGDQINVKAGEEQVLAAALTLATYGGTEMPTYTAPLILRGYTSAANDGGKGAIDLADYTMWAASSYDCIAMIDLNVRNNDAVSSSALVLLDNDIYIYRCKFSAGGKGVQIDNYGIVDECEFTDFTGDFALRVGVACTVRNCYFKDDATNKPVKQLFLEFGSCTIKNCIFSTAGDTIAIVVSEAAEAIEHCTFYGGSNSCTGTAIHFDNTTHYGCTIRRNIIAGYDSGKGIDFGSLAVPLAYYGQNAFYDNGDNEANEGDALTLVNPVTADNEALVAEVFAKSGDDTFANRKTYFAPLKVGNLRLGSGEFDKGAVQHVPDYPDAGNVTEDDTVNGVAGTFAVPAEEDVESGVQYGAAGTEFTGTLEISGLSETQMEAILDARGLTEPASDTADSVARRGASAVTLSDVGSGGGAMHSTTIATLASQTSFTLTAGSADDDAYAYCVVVVTDESTATQKCVGVISDYTGATKTVTLGADPAIFTMAVGDTVEIYPPVGLRWINGTVASGAATVDAHVVSISDNETAADTLELFLDALDQATGQIDSGSLAAGTITAATFAADVDAEVLAWIVDNSTGDGVRIDSAALNTCTSVNIPAIKNKTDNLPSDPAGQSAVEAAITAAASPLATSAELTALASYGDSHWATATGFLDAADVRDAIGMSAANLDTQLSAISGYVDCLPATWVVPPAGSDWTATRAGYIDKLNVTGALAHSDAAATYKADVSGLATSTELAAVQTHGDTTWATATGFSTLDAADVRTALGMAAADLDDQLTAIGGTVDSLSSGVTVSDKTGFSLASDGLDAIATTAPSGPATTFREMVVQTWRWFFKRATKTSESLVTYADDGMTPITTQAITASGTDEERGAAT